MGDKRFNITSKKAPKSISMSSSDTIESHMPTSQETCVLLSYPISSITKINSITESNCIILLDQIKFQNSHSQQHCLVYIGNRPTI